MQLVHAEDAREVARCRGGLVRPWKPAAPGGGYARRARDGVGEQQRIDGRRLEAKRFELQVVLVTTLEQSAIDRYVRTPAGNAMA